MQALAAYERLLRRRPAHADALHYSGVLLYQTGRLEQAAAAIERSLKIAPQVADAWCNFALVLQAQGHMDRAESALRQAVQRDPQQPQFWNNLAGVLLTVGRAKEAETSVRRALALDGADASCQFTLALCFEAQGRLDEALRQCGEILQTLPDAIPPAGLKAQIEEAQGKLDSANATLAQALTRNGDQTAAAPLYTQRASIEQRQGKLAEAMVSLEQVLKLDPGASGAVSELLFLRKQVGDWRDLTALRARFLAGVVAGQRQLSPFCLLSDPSTRAEQRRCAEQWSAAFPALPQPRRMPSERILRIGYLSADFRQHATAALTAGLFETHDRQRFNVIGYSTGADDGSAMRQRLVAGFDRFIDAHGWSSSRVAAQIAGDGIDILVDLNGHTYGAPTGAVALRPAPIQVNYLGYPGTTGAPFIDYLIGDPVVTPFAHAADYTETLVQLPHSYQVNDRQRSVAGAPSRHELGVPDAAFVFCSFNQVYKLNPETLDAWARILAAVPDSVLWLLGGHVPSAGRLLEANLHREIASRGIDASRLRLCIAPTERRICRVVPARRSFSRHVAVQRAHHRERCALGGLPGADLARRYLCRQGRCESADGGRVARIDCCRC